MSKDANACNSLILLYFYLRYQVKVERKASEKALRKSLTGSYTSVSVILCGTSFEGNDNFKNSSIVFH